MPETNHVLDACYHDLSPWDLEALLDQPSSAQLTELLLEGNPLGDRGAANLANWRGIARIAALNHANTGIGSTGVKAPLNSAHKPQPLSLHLDENPLYDEGIRLLVGDSFVSRVRHLGLGCTGLDKPGVHALVESPFLQAVETLDLTQTELSEETWTLLKSRFTNVLGA